MKKLFLLLIYIQSSVLLGNLFKKFNTLKEKAT